MAQRSVSDVEVVALADVVAVLLLNNIKASDDAIHKFLKEARSRPCHHGG
jgi:hypothetical protein